MIPAGSSCQSDWGRRLSSRLPAERTQLVEHVDEQLGRKLRSHEPAAAYSVDDYLKCGGPLEYTGESRKPLEDE